MHLRATTIIVRLIMIIDDDEEEIDNYVNGNYLEIFRGGGAGIPKLS